MTEETKPVEAAAAEPVKEPENRYFLVYLKSERLSRIITIPTADCKDLKEGDNIKKFLDKSKKLVDFSKDDVKGCAELTEKEGLRYLEFRKSQGAEV